jgi:cob(I)alamin adenosyltransferase
MDTLTPEGPPPKSSLYSRKGDTGYTRNCRGLQYHKNNPLMSAIGTVDELNSAIGCIVDNTGLIDTLRIQEALFEIGADLAGGSLYEDKGRMLSLEKAIDQLDWSVGRLKNFVLPQGNAHLARAVCRRAEREAVEVYSCPSTSSSLAYLNRLSDFLFALARALNHQAGRTEKLWIS